jgi:hypothetical protein
MEDKEIIEKFKELFRERYNRKKFTDLRYRDTHGRRHDMSFEKACEHLCFIVWNKYPEWNKEEAIKYVFEYNNMFFMY